jgi:hypothetical protein
MNEKNEKPGFASAEARMERYDRSQCGVALLLAIFALFLVTSIGLGVMYLSDSETFVNSNFRDEQTAYYAARAGLEEARDRMRSTSGSGITISSSLPTAKPGAAAGVLYVLNPSGSETVAPWSTSNPYFDDEICREISCGSSEVPPTPGWYVSPALTASSTYASSPVLPYKWMRITLKMNQSAAGTANVMYVNGNSSSATSNDYVCWDGSHEIVSSTACTSANPPVYLLTALAMTPSGSRRVLQYELTRDSLDLSFPGALTLNGTGDVMGGSASKPFQVQGSDHSGCGGSAGASGAPAIAVSDSADRAGVTLGIPSNRWSNYTGGGSSTPDVETATMPANFQSVTALQSLVSTIENNANQVLTGPVSRLSNPGTAASPQVIVVNGDLTLSGNVTGYGILLVTGTYSASGTVGWNGIVLVIGKGIAIGTGGGSNQYNGAFFLAQIVDPTTGTPLSTLGSSTFNWSGGGGNGIYYSSPCITQASALADYRIIASRELLY